MSLVREIQSLATDHAVPLSSVLRKAKILAARLGHAEFKEWVDRELNGYPDWRNLPGYRIVPTPNFGTFSGPFGSGLKNAPIPSHCVPEKAREIIEQHHLVSGVSAYEQLLDRSSEDPLQVPWDANLIALVGQQIYRNMSCIGAWQYLADGAIAAMLDTVRNKLLDFVLEIEAAAPDVGEAAPGARPIPSETVSQIFNTYITSGNAVVGGSHENVNIHHVATGDFNGLREHLRKLGVENSDIGELEQAISADPKPKDSSKLGSRVAAWIGKMVTKAASGVWTVSTKVAGDVLSKLISSYYGLK